MVAFVVLAGLGAAAGQADTRWVASWTSPQQLPEPHNALAPEDLRDATLRQIVHLSIGGPELRVRLSNRFGSEPLRFDAVHVARPSFAAPGQIVAASDAALTFAGRPDVIVPAGADYVSDPVKFPVAPLSDLAITLHFDSPPARQTGHPGSRATSYLAHGDLVAAPDLPNARRVEHWYFVADVEVAAPAQAGAVVVLGDSITDGHGATTDGNDRWPDVLARRLQADPATQTLAVLNQGIGGNRLLLDGLGPNALARFDHDVLAPPGGRYLIVLEGINDLGTLTREHEVPEAEHEALVHRILAAYRQLVTRARAHGIRAFGGTLTPFVGSDYYHPGPSTEADRQAINDWIRAPGNFDAVLDFDAVVRDPSRPEGFLPAFDSGDHLHPSPAGYAAMAQAVPLSLFTAGPAAAPPRMAITFDDLPAHGPLPTGTTRLEIARKILAALRAAGMPPTYGFVNASLVEQQPADRAVLEAWRDAGQPLGNHTWSHMNLNQHALEEFRADLERDEPLLRQLMKGGDWHWFRFPYLAEGDTQEKRAAARSLLLRDGYKVAGVTMSFADYLWTDPYARCKAKGDEAAIATLKRGYLQAADQSIGYSRGLSHALFGRDVPYVLLMHVGALDAELLPELLELYRARGFRFVTLPEAESDPFYREDTDLSLPPGPDSLEAVAAERGLPLPLHAPPPLAFDAICR